MLRSRGVGAATPGAPPTAVERAEEALHAGRWLDARGAASEALARPDAARGDVGRALFVLLQVDFRTGRLTDLEGTAKLYGRDLRSLPVTAVLLWGVIALEMEAGDAARALLGAYTSACGDADPSPSRDDRLALSRLYALRVLRGACGDAAAARAWLRGGGAGLLEDQRRMVLAELDEAEAAAPTGSGPAAGGGGAKQQPQQQQPQQQQPQQQQQQQQPRPPGEAAAAPAAPAPAAAAAAAAADWAHGGLGRPGQFFTMTGEIEELEGAWPLPADSAGGGGGQGGEGAEQAAARGLHGDGRPPARQQEGGAGAAAAAAEEEEEEGRQPGGGDALRALRLDRVPPWQLAAGGAAAAALGYSLYRERRAARRAAARLAGGALAALSQVAAMATGFEPDAMAAAPRAHAG
ncbi:MAG: hypothetical protein J3K34DRAFT_519801 [Monoraphidium minutum]|nr:MAG: hypothetical protein J3K34DRAFT_519801 [Monoraphidium minutum]